MKKFVKWVNNNFLCFLVILLVIEVAAIFFVVEISPNSPISSSVDKLLDYFFAPFLTGVIIVFFERSLNSKD